jgi:hypothetical protein
MNIFDIIDFTRKEILDDTKKPYGWENQALLGHLNRAYEELCRESKCLIDSSTVTVCNINLFSNQGEFPYHSRIIYVYEARRQSDGVEILPKTEEYMNGFVLNWRNTTGTPRFRIMNSRNRYFTVYPKFDSVGYVAGTSNIDFSVDTGPIYSIEQSGATLMSHFTPGDTFSVTGTTSNNGTFTVVNVTNTQIIVNEIVTGETNTNAILRKVRDVAILRVARLPLASWTLAELEGDNPPSPEIDETYHLGLCDGIAKFAFRKQDTETYDPQKSVFHSGLFEEFKSMVTWDMASLMEGDTICTPHYGTL